jgi:precorrin-6y C5,15-methyltransferase (decarboxylating) CbiE subunit
VRSADHVIGAQKLLDLFPDCPGQRLALDGKYLGAAERVASLAEQGSVAVLVSGDPGVCSLAALVLRRLGWDRCRVIPGISSVQVAFARLGLSWYGAHMLSAHSRSTGLAPCGVRDCDRIAILGGNENTRAELVAFAVELRETHRAFWCRSLTLPEEQIVRLDPEVISEDDVSGLGILVLASHRLFERNDRA